MGLTVIDAGVLIGFLDNNDAHHLAAQGALASARNRGDQLAIPASAFAEALVSPARAGPAAIQSVRDFADRMPVVISALDAEIAVVAAGLRAKHGQRLELPDALVVATAIHGEADVLITTDRNWPAKRILGYRGSLIKL